MQEKWVQSLGQEGPLEKEMAIHSCILTWKIPWEEEPGGLQSIGSQKSQPLLSDWTYDVSCFLEVSDIDIPQE